MATDTAGLGSQYRAVLDVSVSGSTVTAELRVEKLSGSGYWTAGSEPYSLVIDGASYNGEWSYDFRSSSSKVIRRVSRDVGYQGNTTVTAWAEMGSGIGRSGTMSITVLVANEPGKNPAPSLSFAAPNTVNLSWSQPSLNGASILEYQVQRSTSSSMSGATTVSAGTSRSDSISGLAVGDVYYFRVRARNSQGWGAWSDVRSITVPGAPSAPAAPTLDLTLPNTLEMSWKAPSSGTAITGYDTQFSESSTFANGSIVSTAANVLSRSQGVSLARTIYARVRAKSSQGTGSWSPTASIVIPGPPAKMSKPVLSNVAPTSVDATWTAPADGGAPISAYTLAVADDADFTSPTITPVSAATLSQTIAGLAPGEDYWARVRASNSQGDGEWSDAVSLRTLSGAYVSISGSPYEPAEVYVSTDGGPYLPVTVYESTDGNPFVTVN